MDYEYPIEFKVNKFGDKYKQIRRQSTTEWEIPTGEIGNFAKVKDSEDGFKALIDLNYFAPTYETNEVGVDVYGYDLQINARKENPVDPNHSLRELHRQYRMPDDVDLETVHMRRNKKLNLVTVDAKKVDHYGKDVSFNVFDVNQHHPEMRYI
ncbi:hypothetical protein L596_013178 [Steinernema carpocapsae]|uniref:SHSP domain-containing protein n=1 Tax=Steinernema carpocapsae TaxID=34508 RepID=A0A4V6A508_STECR|nr:hypothetical protein L596_013178 [Steinernema carpocapsae]